MEYNQCCIECHFHFFEELEYPNCWAKRIEEEYQLEWDRQLRLLEKFTCIRTNDEFWMLWDYTWFRTICQQVAPEIYDWYLSLEIDKNAPVYIPDEQLDLFTPEIPF